MKIPSRMFIAALAILLLSTVFAEEWMSFTTADGLAHDMCRCVAVDHDGNVWVGSADYVTGLGGVSKWDGESWTRYYGWSTDFALRSDCINDIAVDSENNVWFATGTILYPGGLTKFDGEAWERFDFDTLHPDSTIFGNWVEGIAVKQNSILLTTATGHYGIMNSDNLFFYDLHDSHDFSPRCILIDSDRIYLGGFTGIYFYQDSLFYPLELSIYPFTLVKHLGHVWAASGEHGLFDIGESTIVHYESSSGLPSIHVRGLFSDGERLWIGSTNGVCFLQSGIFTNFTDYSITPRYSVMDISQDLNRNILIAASEGFYIQNDEEIIWNIEEASIIKPDSKLWCYPNPCFGKLYFENPYNKKEIYNVNGELIDRIDKGQIYWNPGDNLPNGIYLVTTKSEEKTIVKKINLIR